MCGRFTLFSDISDLSERFGFTTVIEQLKPSYNVAPSQQVLVVTENEGNTQAEFMKWGFVPNWAGGESSRYNFINARLETANLKASFSAAFRYRRCLIIANGFYEWDRRHKHPNRIIISLSMGDLSLSQEYGKRRQDHKQIQLNRVLY